MTPSSRDLPITTGTGLCAVIGNPVGHSLSPAMHNAAYRAAALDYVYLAFEVDDLAGFVQGLRAMPSFRGVSVTIPHKLEVIPLLDEVDPLARRVGSVNTITSEQGRLVGSTTDGPGTIRAFQEAGIDLQGARVLFLGGGGAVRAVAFAMAEQGCEITLLGRNPARMQPLAGDLAAFGATARAGDLGCDLEAALDTHDIVVQGTPLGMYPHDVDKTPIPRDWLRPDHVIFDMVYRPLRTRLIREAEEAGCTTILGLEMLVNQAELQHQRWMGAPPPEGVMRQALLAALQT